MSRRDPLDVLFDAASRESPPPRSARALDEDVALAVLVAGARERRRSWAAWLGVAAAALVIGALGARAVGGGSAASAPSDQTPARTRISLPGGDVLWSDRAARLDVRDENGVRSVALDEGDVLFDVARLASGASFVVDAGDVRVRVTGTVFAITRSARAVRVTVFEGSVITETEGSARSLAAGETWASDALADAPSEAIMREGSRRAAARTVAEATSDVVAPPRERIDAPLEDDAPEQPSAGHVEVHPTPRARTRERAATPSIAELRRRLVSGEHDAVLAVLANDPRRGDDAELDLLAADALRAARRYDEAVREYESVARRSTPSRGAEAGFLAASLCLRSLDDGARALAILDRTHADDDGSPVEEQATALRARAEHALGLSEASATARRYLARFPGGVARAEMEQLATR